MTGCHWWLCLSLLWPWPFHLKIKSCVAWPSYMCDLIWVKLAQTVTQILYSHSFPGHWLLWPWPLTPKSNQQIYKPKYICGQSWVKLPSLFLRYCIHKVFGMHRFTHSKTHRHGQTDPNTECLQHCFSQSHHNMTWNQQIWHSIHRFRLKKCFPRCDGRRRTMRASARNTSYIPSRFLLLSYSLYSSFSCFSGTICQQQVWSSFGRRQWSLALWNEYH